MPVLIGVITAEVLLIFLGMFFTVTVHESKYNRYTKAVQPTFIIIGFLILVMYLIYLF